MQGVTALDPSASAANSRSLSRIDCDIHNELTSIQDLIPYLPGFWVEQVRNTVFRGPQHRPYPPAIPLAVAPESRFEGGPPPLGIMRTQTLGEDVESGILNCTYAVDSLHNPDQAVALARAVNDWQIHEWLDQEPRLRGSIVIPIQIPELAVEEIERVADHPGFVQVLLPVRSQHPYGSRLYRPVWQALARHGLVAGIHFGGAPGNPPTAVGWPSYYIEEYVGMSFVFASQVTSLVCEGVFDSFPATRVTLLESGVSWLPTHMWRFDKEWKNLRRQVPWVKRPPSEYIRDHFRLTIQPFDGAAREGVVLEIIDQLGSEDMLLYASDYPHRQATDPDEILRTLPQPLLTKIASQNAKEWYQL